jgi:hypothetical protein
MPVYSQRRQSNAAPLLRVRIKNKRGANARVTSVDVGEICQRSRRNENFLPISQRSRAVAGEDVRRIRVEAYSEIAHLRRQAEHRRRRRDNECLVHSKRRQLADFQFARRCIQRCHTAGNTAGSIRHGVNSRSQVSDGRLFRRQPRRFGINNRNKIGGR